MATQINQLADEKEDYKEVDYDDLHSIVMDLSNSLSERLTSMTACYEQDQERAIESLSTLTSMYQMSGITNLEMFLYQMCEIVDLPSFFRLEAAKALLEYEELEDEIESGDDEEECLIKIEENKRVVLRNRRRQQVGASGLKNVCLTMGVIPTPCRVEAICLLMKHEEHKDVANGCFKELINDTKIDCDFRYKTILDLEHHGAQDMREQIEGEFPNKKFVEDTYERFSSLIQKEFPKFKPVVSSLPFFQLLLKHISYTQLLNLFHEHFPDRQHRYEHFIYEAQLSFLTTNSNRTSYRILAGQYLLQKFTLSAPVRELIQKTLLQFAMDTELDYNLQADATDVLMQLGDDIVKSRSRQIIMELGRHDGEVITVFDNAQNVHTEEVEASVAEVLEFFAGLPTLRINEIPIEFSYVRSKVEDMLKKKRKARMKETVKPGTHVDMCQYCENGIDDERKEEECCSELCQEHLLTEKMIKLALNRIEMDRALYSKYNSTLVNILLKVWTYMAGHESEEEMHKRLLQELEEMSGTCSSGFASRLINVISGFGEFNIRISWGDQIKANLSGRLNAAARNIASDDSLFRKDPYMTEMVELCLNEEESMLGEKSSKSLTIARIKEKQVTKTDGPTQHITMKDVVSDFLSDNTKGKVEDCIEHFLEHVLEEMAVISSQSSQRRYFSLFFRSHVAAIREEMYSEFKEYMDDTTFDLYMRKAMMHYEGAL